MTAPTATKIVNITLWLGTEKVFSGGYSLIGIKVTTPSGIAAAFLEDMNVIYNHPNFKDTRVRLPDEATEIEVELDGEYYSFPIITTLQRRVEFLSDDAQPITRGDFQ
jgi:hypothetical protein